MRACLCLYMSVVCFHILYDICSIETPNTRKNPEQVDHVQLANLWQQMSEHFTVRNTLPCNTLDFPLCLSIILLFFVHYILFSLKCSSINMTFKCASSFYNLLVTVNTSILKTGSEASMVKCSCKYICCFLYASA